MDDRKDVEELAARLLVSAYGAGGPISARGGGHVDTPIERAFVVAEAFIAERDRRRA
jgi:hypothetical protein